jgi:tellurite resistance protein TerC
MYTEYIPLWAWILFYVLVFIMLLIDLKSFGKKGQHEVSVSEALKMTAVWIAVSLVFCAGIYIFYPGGIDVAHEKGMEFLAGYLIEKSLSMDNLFVFLMLFSFFGVERKYQHEVLFWGIFGALILRSIFIFAGTAIIQQFEWVLILFGIFLIYTGLKMFRHNDEEESVDVSKNIFVKLFKKFSPVTDKMYDDKFFIIENGKRFATPLFICLIVVETTDVAFAVDSIPAVFSVSRDPFIVLTSNIFAILGLRAMYFALAAVAKYFTYLKYGLGIILSFVGIKMLLDTIWDIEVSTSLSLCIIFGLLLLSIVASMVIKKRTTEV